MIYPDLKTISKFEFRHSVFEIISFNESTISLKILKSDDKQLNSYIDINKVYSAKLSCDYDDFKIWVINENELKKTTSQLLIAWENGKFNWELDS